MGCVSVLLGMVGHASVCFQCERILVGFLVRPKMLLKATEEGSHNVPVCVVFVMSCLRGSTRDPFGMPGFVQKESNCMRVNKLNRVELQYFIQVYIVSQIMWIPSRVSASCPQIFSLVVAELRQVGC